MATANLWIKYSSFFNLCHFVLQSYFAPDRYCGLSTFSNTVSGVYGKWSLAIVLKLCYLPFYDIRWFLFRKWHFITFYSFIIGSKGDDLLESIYMGVQRGIQQGVQKRGYRFCQQLFLVITSLHTKYTQEKMEGQSRLSISFKELTTPKA